jgi:hypothetical protein
MKRSLGTVLAVILVLIAAGLLVSSYLKTRQAKREALAAQEAPRGRPPREATLQDPQARRALSLVGTDAKSEEIWVMAINNPSLNAHERKDLIEDLNEEGFSDPKRLTAADLPLIQNRIKIIEQLAPRAMDQVNAEAFQEAHKDLMEMRDRLQAQATPAPAPAR